MSIALERERGKWALDCKTVIYFNSRAENCIAHTPTILLSLLLESHYQPYFCMA